MTRQQQGSVPVPLRGSQELLHYIMALIAINATEINMMNFKAINLTKLEDMNFQMPCLFFISEMEKIYLFSKLSLPVKSIAVELEDSFGESILCKSRTSSDGIDENASLDKYKTKTSYYPNE
ncbi:hypothetical protein VNO78_06738 [Psophocarpus tetragonolobus]|uniref:Uncharacterized protein n=1 Tax=Psophocarpus tetragonolobus TaxID=3891 RepID=A0AAN9XSE7_PSOTE